MKKLKSLKLMLLAVVALFSSNAFADDTSAGGFNITTAGANATITSLSIDNAVTGGTLVIPATLTNTSAQTFKVVAVAADAFTGANITTAQKNAITTVTIDDTNVATIGARAFKGLTNLVTVNIGKAVTTINASAFEGCSKLATVNFPTTDGKVNSIAADAFKGSVMTELDLSNTKVTVINAMFGASNAKLETVKFPTTLTNITANAFKDCSKLANVIFNKANTTPVQTIQAGAFDGTAIAHLDLTNTKVEIINNLFGTSFARAAQNYTVESAAAANAGKTVLAATALTADEANIYNSFLANGFTYGDAFTLSTADLVNLYNGSLAGAVNTTTAATADNVTYINTYNATLIGAVTTATQIAAANATLADLYEETYGDALAGTGDPALFTAAEAANYNALLDGALALITAGENFTAAQANAYNATLAGAKKLNENLDADEINAYNATLAGHKATGEVLSAAEVAAYNAAAGIVTTDDVEFPAVAVATTNTKLTKVTFPATWTSTVAVAGNAAGAFENCTALKEVVFNTPAQDKEHQNQVLNDRAFLATAIENLDLTDTYVKSIPSKVIVDGATVNNTLKTVTMSYLTNTIKEKAFYQCAQLNSVTFPANSELATIESFVFGITPSLTAISFENCYKLAGFGAYTPFVRDDAIIKNTELTTITLPNYNSGKAGSIQFTTIGTALANLAALTTINKLDHITAVGDGAFTNDAALPALVLPSSVATLNGKPFGGCTKLASLTVVGQTGNNVTVLTVGTDGTNLFDNNTTLKTVKFTNNVNATFDDDAFKNSTGIETLEIAKGAEIKGGALAAGSFVVAENASIALGKISVVNGDGFITVGDGTKAATVTIDGINANVANNSIVVGKVAVTVGTTTANNVAVAAGKTVGLDFFGEAATSLTFTGKILSAFNSYTAQNVNLTEINLNNVVVDVVPTFKTATNGVLSGALTINWEPADENAKAIFAQDAFAAGVQGENAKVTLNTTTAVAALYGNVEANLYNVIFVAEAETQSIEVAGPSTYKYGKFFVPNGQTFKIAKDQDGAKVVVYEAYVDKEDANTIYVNQLRLIDGCFYVKGVANGLDGAGTAVIVKSDKADDVVAVKTLSVNNSLNYTAAGVPVNEIICMNEEGGMLGSLLKTATVNTVSNADYTLYAMMKPATNGLAWKQFKSNITLPQLTFYVRCAPDASAPQLNVVFTDGSQDDVTGIQNVNAAEQNDGVIYNLQGIRVNGAQKGMYIMNGKKYIQK